MTPTSARESEIGATPTRSKKTRKGAPASAPATTIMKTMKTDMSGEEFDILGDPSTEIDRLANYVLGFAEANQSHQLWRASQWLSRAARNVCGQGYFGCHGGPKCNSDHK